MAENKDRRALDRLEIPGTSVVLSKDDGFKLFSRATTLSSMENISKCGVCVKLENGIKIGDKLRLKLNFPTKDKLEVKGRVRWKSSEQGRVSRIGVQFEPFGKGKYFNSLSSLEKLRKIQNQNM